MSGPLRPIPVRYSSLVTSQDFQLPPTQNSTTNQTQQTHYPIKVKSTNIPIGKSGPFRCYFNTIPKIKISNDVNKKTIGRIKYSIKLLPPHSFPENLKHLFFVTTGTHFVVAQSLNYLPPPTTPLELEIATRFPPQQYPHQTLLGKGAFHIIDRNPQTQEKGYTIHYHNYPGPVDMLCINHHLITLIKESPILYIYHLKDQSTLVLNAASINLGSFVLIRKYDDHHFLVATDAGRIFTFNLMTYMRNELEIISPIPFLDLSYNCSNKQLACLVKHPDLVWATLALFSLDSNGEVTGKLHWDVQPVQSIRWGEDNKIYAVNPTNDSLTPFVQYMHT